MPHNNRLLHMLPLLCFTRRWFLSGVYCASEREGCSPGYSRPLSKHLLFCDTKRHKCLYLFQYIYIFCPPLSRKRGAIISHSSVRLSVRLSVGPSVCHKNFNLGHKFCAISGWALILGMCVVCDKTFPMVPCRDLDGYLWPTLAEMSKTFSACQTFGLTNLKICQTEWKHARPNINCTSYFSFWLIFVRIDSNNTSPTNIFSEITCTSYAPDWWCERLAHFTKTKFEEHVRHLDQYLSNFCQTRANFTGFAGMSGTFRHLCFRVQFVSKRGPQFSEFACLLFFFQYLLSPRKITK